MKRTDKRKVKKFIGQAILFITFNLTWTGMMIFGFMQNTIY